MISQENKKRQKKLALASIAVAAMTVVGGTFAWFTSHEDVTNKLTAVNNYGVSIAENFTPPPDWTPGQDVNKDVYVTNTGNVDAFVKVGLTDSLDITTVAIGPDTAYNAGNKDRYVTLSHSPTFAEGGVESGNLVEPSMPDVVAESKNEVMAKQAGGRIVVKAGTSVGTDLEEIQDGTYYDLENDATLANKNGLYVFEKDSMDKEHVILDGYYYQDGTFYAVGDIVKTPDREGNRANDVYSAKLLVTSHLDDQPVAMDYSKRTQNLITATYGTGDAAIKINITLDGQWQEHWAFDATNNTFFYKDTLKAGATSYKLVDKLEMDGSVKNEAYKDLVYRLRASLDSAQIVKNEAGQDTTEACEADQATWTLKPVVTLDTNGTTTSVAWQTR